MLLKKSFVIHLCYIKKYSVREINNFPKRYTLKETSASVDTDLRFNNWTYYSSNSERIRSLLIRIHVWAWIPLFYLDDNFIFKSKMAEEET